MSKIIQLILKGLSSSLIKAVLAIAGAAKEIFKYLNYKVKDKKETEKIETIEKAEKKLDDVCDNGDIGSLLDATAELGKAYKK